MRENLKKKCNEKTVIFYEVIMKYIFFVLYCMTLCYTFPVTAMEQVSIGEISTWINKSYSDPYYTLSHGTAIYSENRRAFLTRCVPYGLKSESQRVSDLCFEIVQETTDKFPQLTYEQIEDLKQNNILFKTAISLFYDEHKGENHQQVRMERIQSLNQTVRDYITKKASYYNCSECNR
jgi:hypothetical protein